MIAVDEEIENLAQSRKGKVGHSATIPSGVSVHEVQDIPPEDEVMDSARGEVDIPSPSMRQVNRT